MQLLFEITISNLLENVCITGLINLEGLAAVGTDDFMHFIFSRGTRFQAVGLLIFPLSAAAHCSNKETKYPSNLSRLGRLLIFVL